MLFIDIAFFNFFRHETNNFPIFHMRQVKNAAISKLKVKYNNVRASIFIIHSWCIRHLFCCSSVYIIFESILFIKVLRNVNQRSMLYTRNRR
jgi:hypothetical protein